MTPFDCRSKIFTSDPKHIPYSAYESKLKLLSKFFSFPYNLDFVEIRENMSGSDRRSNDPVLRQHK